MAKKKSLKERIDALVNALGAAEKPSSAQIRNELVALALDVEKLEDGQALAEKDARISDLEAALEKSDVQLGNLKVLLEEAGGELEVFRTEWKKQEEEKKREEMPDIQFEILQRLPTEHIGDGATLEGISRRARIPPDEAAVHLNRLEKAGFAQRRSHNMSAGTIVAWHRTIAGDELVLAKRLAGEEEAGEQGAQEAPELTRTEQLVLLAVAAGNRAPEEIVKYIAKAVPTVGRPITNAGTVLLLLVTLRGKKMVNEERIIGTPSIWELSRSGRAYVADLNNFS